MTRFFLSLYLSFTVAVPVAYIFGMLTAYALMRRFVFRASERPLGSKLIRFSVVNAVGLVQVLALSLWLAFSVLPNLGIRSHTNDVAHFLALSTLAITSYFGHRYWTFGRREMVLPPKKVAAESSPESQWTG